MNGIKLGEEDKYLPLLMAIEEQIKVAYSSNPKMRDIDAIQAIKEAKELIIRNGKGGSELATTIARAVRSVAEFSGYTIDDIYMCLSHVTTSIRAHRRTDGARGYLDFIKSVLP